MRGTGDQDGVEQVITMRGMSDPYHSPARVSTEAMLLLGSGLLKFRETLRH
jgi:hypothetical protein